MVSKYVNSATNPKKTVIIKIKVPNAKPFWDVRLIISQLLFRVNHEKPLVNLKVTHIPNNPPMALPITEVKDNSPAPQRTGIYPPAIEPMVIPSKIKNLRDIFLY